MYYKSAKSVIGKTTGRTGVQSQLHLLPLAQAVSPLNISFPICIMGAYSSHCSAWLILEKARAETPNSLG